MTTIKLGNANNLSVNVDNSIGDTIILGNGNNDSVGSSSTGFTGQNDNITLGNGAGDTVIVGFAPFPFGGNTHDKISLGNGAGDSVVSLAATVSVGDGDRDVVTADDGIVTMGKGNNDVFNATPFDTPGAIVTLGNGNGDVVNDFVNGNPQVGNKTITVGNGNDTIYVGNSDTIQVGTGQDSFVFQQTTPGTVGAVTVAGFDPNKGSFTFSSQLTTSVTYQDNAQGNAVITVDSNPADTITLVGVKWTRGAGPLEPVC
jgi:hypothetical protein